MVHISRIQAFKAYHAGLLVLTHILPHTLPTHISRLHPICQSIEHTHTHTHTYSHIKTFAHSHSHKRTISLSLSLFLSHAHAHTHTHVFATPLDSGALNPSKTAAYSIKEVIIRWQRSCLHHQFATIMDRQTLDFIPRPQKRNFTTAYYATHYILKALYLQI